MNHYPLIGRKVPRSCNDAEGTADPFGPISCPACRARLQTKVDADTAESQRHKPDSQNAIFFAGSAANIARILAQ